MATKKFCDRCHAESEIVADVMTKREVSVCAFLVAGALKKSLDLCGYCQEIVLDVLKPKPIVREG